MVKQYLDRVSVRDFDKKPMPKQDVELITKVINNSPTSTNAQQFSAIIITDQATKEWIAKNNFGQKHIADSAAFIVFVGDRTRIGYAIEDLTLTKEILAHEWHRAIVDATIAATYAQDALIAMGYGVTFVGGILSFADELAKRLKLPATAHVVVGLSVGKAVKVNAHKPKVNKVFVNQYDQENNKKELMAYDEMLKDYYQKRGGSGDYLEEMREQQDPKRSYAGFWTAGGKYVINTIKNYK